MTRHFRLLGLLLIAMLALFVTPTVGVAQTPVQDQYQAAPDADTNPDNTSGNNNGNGNANANASGQAPVNVQASSTSGKLAFTGGSLPLVALIGLSLLAAGLVGTVATRKRRTSGSL